MTNHYVYLLHQLGTKKRKLLLPALLIIPILLIVSSSVWVQSMQDSDEDRGATTLAKEEDEKDIFGDHFSKVTYLDQGWDKSDSLWFYNTTQGSDLIPYDFFLVLEKADSTELFRSNENMNRFRYLPQKKTSSNPDALPVGMVADEYKGKKFMGLTCAACHSSQVNYNNVAMRIDGGPSGADMDGFLQGMLGAFNATLQDPVKKQRFIKNVLDKGNYDSEKEILDDLAKYKYRVELYTLINHSNTPYGYARLDAFGRIYNRVLQYVLTEKDVHDFIDHASCGKTEKCEAKEKMAENKFESALAAADGSRDQIVERAMRSLSAEQRAAFVKQFFNSPNAPVSYPFLWDIPQHDYVQWNGIAENAGFGPIGRNTGEVIGVFASLDWEKRPFTPFLKNPLKFTHEHFGAFIGGQGLFIKEYVDFTSSVDNHNLRRLEDHLDKLTSPTWQDAVDKKILPALNEKRLDNGARLFDQHCAACHEEIDRSDPGRRIVANFTEVSKIGTDSKMADNSVDYKGNSGLTKHLYVNAGAGNILLQKKAPVAAILTKATLNVVATPDPDKNYMTRFGQWAYNLIVGFFKNEISPSLKAGAYSPDTSAQPFSSLKSYKGRSLNGIWATAPYLHNGSVPTLYDLLLPAEQRPTSFIVGSRELDVVKVGFKHNGYEGFKFDTTLLANSNKGHEYATQDVKDSTGNIISKALTEDERYDLVEYLKSL